MYLDLYWINNFLILLHEESWFDAESTVHKTLPSPDDLRWICIRELSWFSWKKKLVWSWSTIWLNAFSVIVYLDFSWFSWMGKIRLIQNPGNKAECHDLRWICIKFSWKSCFDLEFREYGPKCGMMTAPLGKCQKLLELWRSGTISWWWSGFTGEIIIRKKYCDDHDALEKFRFLEKRVGQNLWHAFSRAMAI